MPHTTKPNAGGHLEVIVGPMFSGKSEEMIRRITRALIARQRIVVFKPSMDDRYHATSVASHNGRTVTAFAVENSRQIPHLLDQHTATYGAEPSVIAIDEAQFFDTALIPLTLEWANQGKRVILAGLDLDFRGEPFSIIPELLARAEQVDKLTAICIQCGQPATRTQRLIEGKPAGYDDPIVMVGATETYEARCRACHIVPTHSPEPTGTRA